MSLPAAAILLASLTLAAGTAGPDGHSEHHHGPAADEDAHIVVTINPEARVSAVRRHSVPRSACGSPAPLRVHIVNQGFVTAPLKARLVGDGPRHVALDFEDHRLTGRPEEARQMRLTSIGSNPADVTIAFSISEETGDLGGRDRVHLLVACR
jgi:hypothetical protein